MGAVEVADREPALVDLVLHIGRGIQEIADEATLNRGTFYLHYPDKNALLQAMTESRFRDLIARRAITFTDCGGALRAIALGAPALRGATAASSPSGFTAKASSTPPH